MATKAGCLSRAEYLELPAKMTAVPPEQRPAVYACFERYVKKSRAHGTYDAADLVCHLSRRAQRLPARLGSAPVWLPWPARFPIFGSAAPAAGCPQLGVVVPGAELVGGSAAVGRHLEMGLTG